MTKFPDMGQRAKIPWNFIKFSNYSSLKEILLFPDMWQL